jgi:hypothetical protein
MAAVDPRSGVVANTKSRRRDFGNEIVGQYEDMHGTPVIVVVTSIGSGPS